MSRYEFRGLEPHIGVVVGWDGPLETYFAQVWDETPPAIDDEHEPVFWVGCWREELPTVKALIKALEPWAVVPPEVIEWLWDDKLAAVA